MDGQQFEILSSLAGASSPPLNIAVIGATGVGKSRLINAFFGLDVAQVGIGRPITSAIKAYPLPGSNVSIFDTRGLEVEKSTETVGQLEKLIVDARTKPNVDDHIHIAWLCVSAVSRRFEPIYETMAQMLAAMQVPFVIAITKSFGPEALELERHVRSIGWIKAPVIPLVAAPKTAGGEVVVEAFGLDALAGATTELVGPARAAAADYGRYNTARRDTALAALRGIIERKTVLQSFGNLYAMGASIPVMIGASGRIADKMTSDIVTASSALNVQISADVQAYLRGLVAEVVRESAVEKAKAGVDELRGSVDAIAKGDFSSVKGAFGTAWSRAKRNINPINNFKDVISMAKGDHVPAIGHQAWEYLRDITLISLSPMVEAHLMNQAIIGKRESYWRSLNSVVRWSGLAKTIAPELIPVLRTALQKPPS